MSLFQFTSKTNSVVLQIDNQNQIPISGFYIPVVLMPENIKIGFRPTNTIEGLTLIPSIDIGNDSIVIDGVTFSGTTAKELYDLLESLFFLDESSSSGDVGDHFGFLDYNDASTASSPITLSSDTWTDVPNDKLGSFTNTAYAPNGVTNLIDGATGYLDFSDLTLGSDIMIRIDFVVTPNTNNALLETRYVLGQGASEYALPVRARRLDSGSGIPYSSEKGSFYIYMGDTNTLGGVGKLQVKLSANGTLKSNGVAIKIYKK